MGAVASVKWTGLGFVGMLGIVQICRMLRHLLSATREILSSSSEDSKATENGNEGGSKKKQKGNNKDNNNKKKKKGNTNTNTNKKQHHRDKVMEHWKSSAVVLVGGVLLLALIAVVYYVCFVVHFEVLKFGGSGDVWHDQRFLASTLLDQKYRLQAGQAPMSIFELVWELNRKMYEANAGVSGEHSYGSVWYEWPWMSKGMSYWVKNLPDGRKKEIFLGGNIVAYGVTTSMLILYATYLLSLVHTDEGYTKRQRHYGLAGLWLLFGYFLNLLPYIKITRVCFLYHYIPSFYLAVLLSAVVLDKYIWRNFDRKFLVGLMVSVGVLYFYSNYPTYYGNHFVFSLL